MHSHLWDESEPNALLTKQAHKATRSGARMVQW